MTERSKREDQKRGDKRVKDNEKGKYRETRVGDKLEGQKEDIHVLIKHAREK